MTSTRRRCLALLCAVLLGALPIVVGAAPAAQGDAPRAGSAWAGWTSWMSQGLDSLLALAGIGRVTAAGGIETGSSDPEIGSMLDPDGSSVQASGGGGDQEGEIGSMLDPDG